MPNIAKGSSLLLSLLILSISTHGQVLCETQDELDVFGEIYSVKKFDAFGEYYAICGDFNTINTDGGYHNFALLDTADLTHLAPAIITDIDGPIYDVVLQVQFFPVYAYYLYIGGDFTIVNGFSRNGAARLSTLGVGGDLSTFSVDSWNPEFLYSGTNEKVLDIEMRNDTIYFVGDFSYVNNGTLASDQRPGIAAFNASSGADLPMFQVSDPCNSSITSQGISVNRIALGKHHIIASGSLDAGTTGGSFFRFNYDGCLDNSYPPQEGYYTGTYWAGTGKDIEVLQDTVYAGIFSNDLWLDTDTTYYPPSMVVPPNTTKDYQGPPPQPYTEDHSSIASYKDNFYVVREITGTALAVPGLIIIDSSGTTFPPFNSQIIEDYIDEEHEHVFVVDNFCFASKQGTYNVGANQHTGLYALCLEPHDIDSFTVFDTTICQGDIELYGVPYADFAEGYEWSFSGSGVVLDTANFGAETLNVETAENIIGIEFLENFTPGTLTVRPFTDCNNLTLGSQKIYSNTLSIHIGLNPLPNAYAGIDTVINCYNDSVSLAGFSDSAGVSYFWNQTVNALFTDFSGQNYVAHDSDYYVLKVQAPNGCLNFDTVFVDMDTIKPTFDVVPPDVLGCDDTLYFLGHCNNGSDTLSWWELTTDTTNLANPLECTQQGEYNFYTTFTGNGCTATMSPSINIIQVESLPNIGISGYSIPSTGTPIEYITCADPVVSLTAYSDSANTVLNWVDEDTLNPIGDTNPISVAGNYLVEAHDQDNNCKNYVLITVDTNITKPAIALGGPYSSLNCSNDSLVLNGSTTALDSVLTWDGASISPSANPVTIFDPGYYSLTVIRNDNGCSRIDSIEIISDSSIDVIVSNDTAVCDQDPATVNAGYVGTISGISYLWSNGTTTSNAIYTGGNDSLAIVEVSGDGGCYGTDTVRINIPPVPVINFQGFAPCGQPGTGSILATAESGWGPFQYSIDGGISFEPANVIDSLDEGVYTVTVMDSLGCLYDRITSIDPSAAPPSPNFLFSTYNYLSDTIALVDVSLISPDSVNWIIPSEIILLEDNDTLPLITLPTLGTYDITMNAYFGSCLSSLTKSITISEKDTTIATFYNQNGIDTMYVYPNPNDGEFTVVVEFYQTQEHVQLYITNMLGEVMEEISYQHIEDLSQSFVLPAVYVTGNYIIRVVGQYDSDYRIITINR